MPLSGALPRRQHTRLRGAVRAAHQPLQREDIHIHLVLAHLCGLRVHIRPPTLDMVLVAVESHQLSQKVPQAHGPAESREVRQEDVPHVWRTLSAPGRRARPPTHRQEQQSGDHGRDHVSSVGPLQAESGRRRRLCLVVAVIVSVVLLLAVRSCCSCCSSYVPVLCAARAVRAVCWACVSSEFII